MCFSQTLFIIAQSCLLILLALHDWVDLAPFNDLKATRATSSLKAHVATTFLNCGIIGGALVGTVWYTGKATPTWFAWYLVSAYALFLFGMFMYWYKPMLFGAGRWHKESFKDEYAHTHHVIPGGDEDIRPNTLHVVIHVFIVTSAILAFLKVAGRF